MKNIYVSLLIFLFSTISFSTELKTIHVIVALCDNKNQAIIKVPDHLGNGGSPNTNLYWGALYGVKTYFTQSPNWQLINQKLKLNESIVERLIFRHSQSNTFLIADAYYGYAIKEAINDVIQSSYGEKEDSIEIYYNSTKLKLGILGDANLLSYIGHNGLMEFTYDHDLKYHNKKLSNIIILACDSKSYFAPYLKNANVKPLLITTDLMAPEAYILEPVLEGWIKNESGNKIKLRAAQAYNKYQKCGLNAAQNLFDNEW